MIHNKNTGLNGFKHLIIMINFGTANKIKT